MKTLINKFRFDLPSEWQDQTAYYFRGPEIDGQEHRLMLHIDRIWHHENIYDFSREKISPLVNELQSLEILKDEDVTMDNGNPVYEFVGKWIPVDEVVVIKKYVFVFFDNMGFTFTCDFSKKSYKMLNEQMKKLIDSLLPGTYLPLEDD